MMEPESEQRAIKIGLITISEKERNEFDNITGDQISQVTDCDKLRRLDAYMSSEGLAPTAEAARFRLRTLGSADSNDSKVVHDNPAVLKASKAELKSWTASMSGRGDRQAPIPGTSSVRASGPSLPAVRAAGTLHVQPGAVCASPGVKGAAPPPSTAMNDAQAGSHLVKQDSKFGGQVRSGKDYYQAWDKFAEKAGGHSDDEDMAPAPVQHVPKTHASSAAAPARGPALTEWLIAANEGLSLEEVFNANAEKVKGNECFRSKEYAQAVERYTVSLGYVPAAPSVHANRAAAYIKLRMWDAAVADCDEALAHDPAQLKARVRRAAARLELGKATEAMEDIEAALVLDPANTELLSMHEKANKALARTTVRRIAIEEDSDGEDSRGDERVAGPHAAAAGSTQQQRTKIVVVEESDDSDEGETCVGGGNREVKQASPTSPLPPSRHVAAAAAPAASAALPPAPAPAPTALVAERKVRIAVVEDDGSDSDTDTNGEAAAAARPGHPAKQEVEAEPAAVSPSPIPAKAAAPAAAPVSAPAAIAMPATAPSPVPAPVTALAPYMPAASPAQQASLIKEDGNRRFAQGDYSAALSAYKQAVALDPASALLHANMAISKLRAGDARGCLAAASVAVALDPTYHKAMHRRALAKRSLGLLQAAYGDLKVAHDMLGPGHKDKAALAEDMRAVINDMVAAEKQIKAAKAAKAAPVSRQHKYKGGLTIEEVDEDEDGADRGAQGAADGAQLTPAQLRRVEDDAATLALRLKREAASALKKWELEEQQRRQAWDVEQAQAAAAAERANKAAAQAAAAAHSPEPKQTGASDVTQGAAAGVAALDAATSVTPATSAAAALSTFAASASAAPSVIPASASVPSVAAAPSAAVADDDGDLERLRLRGNDLFRAGDHLGALRKYEMCIERDPGSVAVHANVALVKLQLGDAAGALQHCDAVLAAPGVEVNAKLKAQHRRAQALAALDRLPEALAAYKPVKAALKVHQQVDKEIEDVARRIAAQQEQQAGEADAARKAEKAATAKAVELVETARQMEEGRQAVLRAAKKERASQAAAEAASAEVAASAEATRSAAEKAESCPGAKDNAASQAAAGSTQRDEDEASQQRLTADEQRLLGNSLFPSGRYEEAAAAYACSIEALPSAASFSNRALAFLKMQLPAPAEADCRSALALEPGHLKARHRLALALKDQGRPEDALRVYDKMLAAAAGIPKGNAAQLTKERHELALAIQEQGKMVQEVLPAPAVPSPPPPPPQQQPQQPQRTPIVIQESNSSDDEDEDAASPSLPVPRTSLISAAGRAAAEPAGTSSPAPLPTSSSAAASAAPSASSASSAPAPAPAPEPAPALGLQAAAAAKAALAIDKLAAKRPAVPRSAVEFERSCKLVSGSMEVLVDFVKSVQPGSYQGIFKDAISGPIISTIVRALRHCVASDPAFVELSLRKLSEVNRFTMAVSMISKADKAVVGEVLSLLEGQGLQVAELRTKFRVPA